MEILENAGAAPRGRKLLREKELTNMGAGSHSTIWRRAGTDPTWPRPIKLGENSIAWFEDEILAWLATRPRLHAKSDAADSASIGPQNTQVATATPVAARRKHKR
jgi:predicted DNA-binding transcriptional regulator AlpA